MKGWLLICIGFLSCQSHQSSSTTSNRDTLNRSLNDETSRQDTAISETAPVSGNYLIVPGKSVGKVSLGMEASVLDSLLGRPDKSDAAMGKAWLTWNGKRDEHNNATELNIYTTYSDSTMRQKTVQQIRTTSSVFATATGLRVYASLAAIKQAFSHIKKSPTIKPTVPLLSMTMQLPASLSKQHPPTGRKFVPALSFINKTKKLRTSICFYTPICSSIHGNG